MSAEKRFQLGDYFIGRRHGSPVLYRCWMEGRVMQRVSLGTKDFEEAKRRLSAWWAEQYRLQSDEKPPQQVMLADVILDYWNHQASALRSAPNMKIQLRYWNEFWGDVTVADVRNPAKQDDFRKHLAAKGLGHTSVIRCLEAGRAAIRRAWKRGAISSYPHIEVPPMGETEPKGRPLSVEEVGKLLRGTNEPHMQLVTLLLLGTAARSEPILTLDWKQVDFTHGLIQLNPEGRKQTSKRRPVVKLPDTLRAVLEPMKGEGRVIMFRGRLVGKIDHGFRNMVARAELTGHVTPYSLRHTIARWMRMKGVPMEQVSGQLGHAMPGYAMSERYAPHDPAYLVEACRAIDEFLALVLPAADKLMVKRPAFPNAVKRAA